MQWNYLSPHFDDAVLSCGGMIWEQIQAGDQVQIWTVCAGKPPVDQPLSDFANEKHAVWKTGLQVISVRLKEDQSACQILGASARRWSLPDCIYRRLPAGDWVVERNEDLWNPLHPGELGLVGALCAWLRRGLKADACLVSPLSLGNHLDHRLVRAAAERLRRPLYYYADYPYIAQKLLRMPVGMPVEQLYQRSISPRGLQAWQDATAAYVSQVDDLFKSEAGMRAELAEFWQRGGGQFLWKA